MAAELQNHMSLTPVAVRRWRTACRAATGPEIEAPEKPDVIELLLVLAREKKPILLITLGVAVVATIVVLLLPKTYTATTTHSAAPAKTVGDKLDDWTDRGPRRAGVEAIWD